MQLNLHKAFTTLISICFTLVFTTVNTICISAPLFAQEYTKITEPVTVYHRYIRAADLLNELKTQSNYKFSFAPDQMANIGLTDIYAQNKPMGKLLHELTAHGLLFELTGNLISVSYKRPVPVAARQQPGRISGKVLDERGEPLPGASIKIVESLKVVQTSVDGTYTIALSEGTYTIEVSYISFQTQRVTGIVVKDGKNTSLDLALKPAINALSEVVVTSSYRKASVDGLYARQKNAAAVTDGISAEQIARTPDNNMGEVLKRISGLTTVDNKYVVVRGLSERYNQAMIDGVVLPSTNMNRRNFSFDVLPQEMVSNVVVNKTATPDMSAEFSGGQISVNTLDIPTENFSSVTIGAGYNSQSTGKDFFVMGGRGKYDYLGFDDKRRKAPAGIVPWKFPSGVEVPPPGLPGNNDPLIPGQDAPYSGLDAIAQSKKLDASAYKVARYKAFPHQNLRLALGRVYDLNEKGLKAGFAGGVSYRNQQNIENFNNVRGAIGKNYIDSAENGAGKAYRFNTTLGAVLNMGLQGKAFKLGLKNIYSRIFDDNFYEAYRIDYATDIKNREQFQEPQATEVLQNKLEGEQLLTSTGLKLEYEAGLTTIHQQIQDQRRVSYSRTATIGGVEYFQTPNVHNVGELNDDYDYRMWTRVKERDFNWKLALSEDFDLSKDIRTTAKIGYAGWRKHRALGVTRMIPYALRGSTFEQPYEVILDKGNMGAGQNQAYYWAEGLNGPTFDGTMKTHALYAMLDQRFFQKLRMVYGIRAENYNLSNRQEDYIKRRFGEIPDAFALFTTTGEKNWRILPSINITYSLSSQMNLRAAYSKTAIRPDFRETAYFGFYDYEMDAMISGMQLTSTIVDNVDLRYEWYPAAGEIISISGFYKKMDKPIELVFAQEGLYRFQNQAKALNYGLEMEIRKTLGFIADMDWLSKLTVFGNGTLIKSKVDVQTVPLPGENTPALRLPSLDRPLYGQAPWIINAGLSYQGEILGFTASYNRSGHRTFSINYFPGQVEYENGRNLLDLQLSTQLFRKKAELKLNIGNLLNEYIIFYQNVTAYEQIGEPGSSNMGFKLVNGTTAYEKEKGDVPTFRRQTGRTANLVFTYKF